MSPTVPSSIVLGLWPIAGITTVGVTPEAARETIFAALDAGVSCFDTAYSYGYDGESDRLLGQCLPTDRTAVTVIGKVGQRWTPDRVRVNDGSPKQIVADAEHSLQRIGIEYFDSLLLHLPGPNTPISESATALLDLVDRGLCKEIGMCNASPAQLNEFHSVAPCAMTQCSLNMVQHENIRELIPACAEMDCKVYVYWTLMKGLLSGAISRDHAFAPNDVRPGYGIFQGEQRERTHRLLDRMAVIAAEHDRTVAQLAIGWCLSQPGVTGALIGARYPSQIQETAVSKALELAVVDQLNSAVAEAFTAS